MYMFVCVSWCWWGWVSAASHVVIVSRVDPWLRPPPLLPNPPSPDIDCRLQGATPLILNTPLANTHSFFALINVANNFLIAVYSLSLLFLARPFHPPSPNQGRR